MIVTRGIGGPRNGSIVASGYTIAALAIIVTTFRDLIRFTLRVGQSIKFNLER
ncbi:hypothetical protein LCGC14_0678730 [marine sediment metagenome]|uniref:Uncharacterized protein n=1 Tax=marine sediment metagenome TaxID=412755 RepID=A0A0F9TWV2_9ZZZZ